MSNVAPPPPAPNPPTPPAPNTVASLLTNPQGLMVVVVVLLAFGSVFTHSATFAEATDFLKYIVGPWLLADGAVQAARHYGSSSKGTTINVSPPSS